MNFSRLIHVAEDAAPDDCPSGRTGARVRTAAARLPAIDAGPILMRNRQDRRAVPGLENDDGEADPFDFADLIRQVEDASQAAARAWPDLSPAPAARADAPAGAADGPRRALAAERAELAELQEVKRKQAAALRQARDEILSLDDQVKLLRAKLTQQEKETAAAQQAALRADADRAGLATELEQANANFAELLQRTDQLNATVDQKDNDIALARKKAASLTQELLAKAGQADLTAAIEEAKARYYKDFDQRYAQFEAQLEKLARLVGARDERIRSLEDVNARLTARCDALAEKVNALEAAKRDVEAAKQAADDKLDSQMAVVRFLDTTLRAEREAAAQKIAALTADLKRERMERAANAHDSAAACREIARLLPRLGRETPAKGPDPSGPA